MKEAIPIKLDKETRDWLGIIVKAQKVSIGLRWWLIALIVATASVISVVFQILDHFRG